MQAGAAAGGSLLLPLRWAGGALGQTMPRTVDPATLPMFVDSLPVPPTWTAEQLAGRGLTMAESVHQFHRDLFPSRTWGYGGATYLGPTIEGRRGEPVSFLARNRLGPHILGVDEALHGPDMANDQFVPRVSLHLHGGYTEPASDGYPEDTFIPGENHIYNYAMDQQAGTIWYHDHALGITRLNVYAGLAAFFPIRDGEAEGGLPPRPFEVPLAIQDKTFLEASGGMNPLFYPDPWEPEFFGDVAVVNGKVWPNLDVVRGLYRFRLLNGSSSRFYNLFLEPALPMWLIGTESGFVPSPIPLTNIVLAPGERADVLIDFNGRTAGDRVRLRNAPLPPEVVSPAEVDIPDIMQFTVGRRRGFPSRIPTTLRAYPAPTETPVTERNLLLVEIIDPVTDEPVMALLNNRRWATSDIERPVVNTLEQWNLINLTEDTHPIHLHLAQFRLQGRQPIDAEGYLEDVLGTAELHPDDVGSGDRPFPSADPYATGPATGPAVFEDGWKDTIQAHPGMVTRIVVPFGGAASASVPFGAAFTFTGEYVWHCHILDHEDHEMMLPYEVIAP